MTVRFGSIGATALLTGVILAPLGSWGHSTGSPSHRPANEERPNLVLITVDSLRADHLGVYGYQRPTSPNIDAFAREAVVVSDAIAQAPQTKASVASLLTSLFPAAHRARATTVPLTVLRELGSTGSHPVDRTDVLDPDLPTLPRSLRAAGYHTMALTANPYLIPDFGFANGFVQFRYVKGTSGAYARADVLMTEAARAVAAAPEPFFLWVHLMDPHNPYDSPEPYRSRLPALKPPRPINPSRIPDWVRLGRSADLNLYLARYDAGVLAADHAIGRFLSMLRAKHAWARTAVVLTADHGEGFLEHDLMSHGNSLYDELLHVPLIVKLPGVRPGVVRTVVQLADLFPTLARLTGATPPTTSHGRDVLPVLQGLQTGRPFAYAELLDRRFAIRTLDWKLISSLQGGRQLFNLQQDRGETMNLARVETARADRLERDLARLLAVAVRDGQAIEQRSVAVPPVVLERLRALGYLAK